MNQIVKSNLLTLLADRLAESLYRAGDGDPFYAPEIIVPNLDTARWLQLHIAEKIGFAGNLNFMLPAEWQWNQIRKLYPDLPKSLPADSEPMKWAIYSLLSESDLERDFPVVGLFLQKQAGAMKERALLRFSAQISSIFDQYLIYRPEMLLRWQNGKTNDEEEWQARLWNRLNDRWRERAPEGEHFRKNKAEFCIEAINKIGEGLIDPGRSLSLFNPGLIPEPVVKMIRESGKATSVSIYLISMPELDEPQNPLLHSLSEEMKSVQKLYDITGFEVDEIMDNHFPKSGLGRIRKSLYKDMGSAELEQGKMPAGVEIRSCHSELREVETLQRFLVSRFDKDPKLHPDDVLVVTPDTERYEQAVHAVFGASESGLPSMPYHIGGSVQAGEYGLLRSFQMLTGLPESRFTFSEVMDLFQTRAVMGKFGVSEADTATVRNWMEQNHVTWGLNDDHRRELGQPEGSPRTWEAAIRRGWLGQWLPADSPGEFSGELLFHSVENTGEQQLWAAFSAYLNLLGDFRAKTKGNFHPVKWTEITEEFMERVFSKKSMESLEVSTLLRSIKKIREAGELAGSGMKIKWNLFSDELKKLSDQSSAAGARFTRGVTFSSMVPVRSIPFKIVAMVGLNENEFPRKPSAPGFDLMAKYPKAIERNRKKEDRNLFLESILAAQEIHYLSYIGRRREDNEVIAPSPVVGEWIDYISGSAGIKVDKIIREEPLTIFSPESFKGDENFSDLARKSAEKILSGEEKPEGLITGSVSGTETETDIEVSRLLSFYGMPIKDYVRNSLGVRILAEEEEVKEFELNALDKHILFRKLFDWKLRGLSEQEITEMILQSGLVPEGWAGESEVRELSEYAVTALEMISVDGYSPLVNELDVDISYDEYRISGTITSFSEHGFLDLNPSTMKGKILIASWLKHLLYNVSIKGESESMLYCELKRGKPKRVLFKPPEEPDKVLKELAGFYSDGLSKPVKFFPSTLYEYASLFESDEEKARSNAKSAFEGGSFQAAIGEREDTYAELILGSSLTFDDSLFEERFIKLVQPMIDHMEVK